MKKLSFWLLLLALVYFFLEITAWVSYRVLFGENFSFSRLGEVREKALAALAVDARKSGKVPVYLVHPYYGHIMNPNWFEAYEQEMRVRDPEKFISEPMNAWGFVGATPPLQSADPGKLVVAIAGGSVAAYAGTWGRELFIEGLGKIPALAGRKIVLLNFGTSAYKQPQQVMVVGDILSQGGHIDLLINIDGFNEIALPRGDDAFGLGVSPFFPQPWRAISETNFSRDDMMRLGRIALLQEKRASWAKYASFAPWRYSLAASTVWQLEDVNLLKQKNALERALSRNADAKLTGPVPTTDDGRVSLGPPHGFKDARELYQASAELWARSSVLLNNMVASQGGLYVHVLQPNQHFPGSRPTAAPDAKMNTGIYKTEVEIGYPYLRSAGDVLAQSGMHFNDLSPLFKDDPEPVYADTCCHFTKEGNSKLVKAIVSRVALAIGKEPSPRFIKFTTADYSFQNLRAHALQPQIYHDGSGIELKKPLPAKAK